MKLGIGSYFGKKNKSSMLTYLLLLFYIGCSADKRNRFNDGEATLLYIGCNTDKRVDQYWRRNRKSKYSL